jgi:GTP cyclohydrolase II
MNIVKRFLMKNTSYSTDEPIMIPSGQLYLVRSPSSPKSENECLYNDAILTIRQTHKPFDHQLVVWKNNESDSDSLNGDEDEHENGNDNFFENESNILKTFLIDSSLKICLFERYDEKIISWRDMEGDFGDMFEYRITKTVPNDTIEQFMTSIYKFKYERKYKKSSANINLNDIQEFIVDRNDIFDNCLNSANNASISSTLNMQELLSANRNVADEVEFEDESDSADDQEKLTYENDENISDEEDENEDADDEAKFFDASETLVSDISSDDIKQRILIVDFPVKAYIYDFEAQAFKIKSESATVFFYELSNWHYNLELKDNNTGLIYVTTQMTYQLDGTFKFEQLSFLFNVFTRNNAFTWLLNFDNRITYDEFQQIFMKLQWQYKNEKPLLAKDFEYQYMLDSLDSMDIDENVTNESEQEESSDEEQEEENDEEPKSRKHKFTMKFKSEYDSDDSDDEALNEFNKNNKNSGLVLGLNSDRAFISRGNKIGVFKTDDSGIEFSTAINDLSFSKNNKKLIKPDKMMLLNNDKVMVIQDIQNKDKLHKLDLEYGKIVEDWDMKQNSQNIDVEGFTTNTKFGDLTNDSTFLGVSSKSLFRVDPRVSNGFISDNENKIYKTQTNFRQVSTTGKGYIVVASKNGEIRLYDQLGKNAKTLLPALGDEIYGLTTSNDGRYLLATCKTYLLLIDVKIQSGKFSGKLGYERSFSVSDKPMPRRLQLKPEHMAYIKRNYGSNVSFSIAKFNETSQGKEPTYLVSSIGPYAVTWNFNKVINNSRDCYKLRLYDSNVIMGEFVNTNNKKVVLTMPDDITLTSTSEFRKPNEQFNIVKTKF